MFGKDYISFCYKYNIIISSKHKDDLPIQKLHWKMTLSVSFKRMIFFLEKYDVSFDRKMKGGKLLSNDNMCKQYFEYVEFYA